MVPEFHQVVYTGICGLCCDTSDNPLGDIWPVNSIVEWAKALRTGHTGSSIPKPRDKFLAPLHREIESIAKAMHEAKANAEEEARLRTSAEAIWTPDRLKVEMENLLAEKEDDSSIEPGALYAHSRRENHKMHCSRQRDDNCNGTYI